MDFVAVKVADSVAGKVVEVSARHFGYIKNLKRNFEQLNEKAATLYSKKEDMEREINRDRIRKRPKSERQDWLKTVEEVHNKVDAIKEEYSQEAESETWWFPDIQSHWKLGQRIVEITNQISKLTEESTKFEGAAAVDASPQTVEAKPFLTIEEGTSTEHTLQKILNNLIIDRGFSDGYFSRYGGTCAEAVIEEVSCLKGLTSLEFWFPKMEYLECFLQGSRPWKKGIITSFHFIVRQYQFPDRPSSWFSYCPKVEGSNRILTFCGYDGIPNAIVEVLRHARHANSFMFLGHKSVHSLYEFGMQNMSGLIRCKIHKCDAMGIVVDGNQLAEAALPNLEDLSISHMPNLRSIWEGPFPPGSLNCLTALKLFTCGELKNIFSREIIQQLSNLEYLHIRSCYALEEVISDEEIGVESDYVLPKLKALVTFKHLSKIVMSTCEHCILKIGYAMSLCDGGKSIPLIYQCMVLLLVVSVAAPFLLLVSRTIHSCIGWILRVWRPPHGRRNAQYENAVQQMEIFLKHIVATVDSVDEKYDSWFLYKIMQTIQHQCLKFSVAARFENFNLEKFINSGSYENFNKENQEEEIGQVPPDVHTPQPSPFANPSPTPHPPLFVTPSAQP
ncbi:hypothetical protein MRB53_016150 [Persea americana]|uniref:Uncharacterized protein n=1 Tax=Persea americana TaxID=3435 RepID=A0ACC2M2E1_PERAE|nr:hypothetical protein MRB53_016150 [Persea americana]